MKYAIFTLLLGALSVPATSQITLTQNDIGPVNRKLTVKVDDTTPNVTPGSAGANVTWTVGSLGADIIDTLTFATPQFTPFYYEFPGSNLAMITASGMFAYGTLTNTGFQVLGQDDWASNSSGIKQYYTLPETILEFPLSYQSLFMDTSQSVLQMYLGFDPGIGQIADSTRIYTDTYKDGIVDGWGTLTLPTGSSQVLRLNTFQRIVTITEYYVNGSWISGGNPTIDSNRVYSYWANNVGTPLLQLTENLTSHAIIDAQVVTAIETVTGVNEQAAVSGMNVFPNPANDVLHISTKMESCTVALIDMQGRTVLSENASGDSFALNVSPLEAGTYFLRLTETGTGTIRQEKICVMH